LVAALREAATLVLMRDRPGAAPEVMLVQRHARNATAGGAFVFPGGILEPQDYSAETFALCAGLGAAEAAQLLGADASRALGYFVAAIRESFEEAGILLAQDRADRPWQAGPDEIAAVRAELHAGRTTFAQWLAQRGLRPAVEDLTYFAHWITPEVLPRRFDTRFFLAAVDALAAAEPDGHEVVACRWIAAADALAAQRGNALSLVNATIKTLELLVDFRSVADAKAQLGSRKIIAVRPKGVREGNGYRIINPGEPGYDEL
jgi:8-oxo-dGTP pyrophosphatase MutT (NUDIX family)